MNIRNRLTLGIGILFILILLLGLQSVRSVRQLSVASKDILTDNYNSVHYVGEMLRSLDRFSQDSTSRGILINSLELQQQNITEVNEKEVTSALTQKIDALTDSVSIKQIQAIREDLYRIMELNMNSIRFKSSGMETSAEDAVQLLTILSILCILLAAVFLIRFPAIILRPIDKLKQGITQTAKSWKRFLRNCSSIARKMQSILRLIKLELFFGLRVLPSFFAFSQAALRAS